MHFHTSLLFTLPWDYPLASRFDVAKVISMCAVYLRRKRNVQKILGMFFYDIREMIVA